MTPEKQIDVNLEKILKTANTSLRYYTMPSTLERMRSAMREVMSQSYIQGSNDCHDSIVKAQKMFDAKG